MRAVRRFTVLALIAVFSPVLAHAQDAGGGGGGGRMGGGGGRMQQMLFQGITLNDQQQHQIDSIRTSYRPQMQSASDRDARRDLMQKETADFRTVLTPDQQSTFDKNLADMRSRMQGGGGPPQ
jgi:Spy/CpxP family protein refolding chaperone